MNDLDTLELPLTFRDGSPRRGAEFAGDSFAASLDCFCEFGQSTRRLATQVRTIQGTTISLPTFVNEFWTARQRAANRLHEISYRACFKPHLPRFFIERLTREGDIVHDPFMGRGTTLVEAALL